MRLGIARVSLDGTLMKVYPDGTDAPNRADPRPSTGAEADATARRIGLPRVVSETSTLLTGGLDDHAIQKSERRAA